MPRPNDEHKDRPREPVSISQQAGDRAVQVGQVVGNVVFQLLTPTTAIIIIVALSLAVGMTIYSYRAMQRPARMTGDFNIAVAQFGEIVEGNVEATALGQQISRQLFDFLDSEYRVTDFGSQIQVTHDRIGTVAGATEAEELAAAVNAHIVIYGTLFSLGDTVTVMPRFYIANTTNSGTTLEAQEITGRHEFALPIVVDLSSPEAPQLIEGQLRSRASALLYVTIGLVHYSAGNLEAADRSLRRAIQAAEEENLEAGLETIYLFAGRVSRIEKDYRRAEAYLESALTINPEYARAYIERGNVYYDKAIQAGFDVALLDRALTEYVRAVDARDQPVGANVIEKSNVALGNIYVVRAQQTNDPELFGQAIDYYTRVITQYERTDNERIKELAAIAYFGLGAAHEREGRTEEATAAYRQCATLSADSDLKARAEGQIAIINDQS